MVLAVGLVAAAVCKKGLAACGAMVSAQSPTCTNPVYEKGRVILFLTEEPPAGGRKAEELLFDGPIGGGGWSVLAGWLACLLAWLVAWFLSRKDGFC